MEGKIVFEGRSEKGKIFLIRYIQPGDSDKMLDYINTISQEHTFIRYQGEQLSFKEEQLFLEQQLDKLQKHQTVHLLVFCEDQLIGTASVSMDDKTQNHLGIFGITLHNVFRGQGIGKTLMKVTLEEAEKNFNKLKIVTLCVFGDNQTAQDLYSKFGFIEFGRLPGGVYRNGQYSDLVYMYKKIK